VKRNSIILQQAVINLAANNYPELLRSNIELRVDEENAEEIISFILKRNKAGKYINIKKFSRILYEVLKGNYNDDLYGKEEVSKKAKNVTSMKFKGKQNYRIGCKEIFCDKKKVIMISLFHKKTTKNSRKEKTIYESIGGYEYEC
jgi:UDP-N-acetylglucosamine pyrophosphorylase